MDKCFECEKEAEHYHHVVPKVLGGTKTIPLCNYCHGLVHDRDFTHHKNLTKNGIQKLKISNKKFSRYPPYGYYFDDEDNIIKEDKEQIILNKIKDLLEDGKDYKQICLILTEKGLLNRDNKPWLPSTMWLLIKKLKRANNED